MFESEEIVVVSHVFLLVIYVRGEHHTDGSGGEIVESVPYAGSDEQPLVGMIEEESAADISVVESDRETAADSHNQLMLLAMSVSTPVYTPGDIIQIINPSDVERDRLAVFNHCQVSLPVSVMAV